MMLMAELVSGPSSQQQCVSHQSSPVWGQVACYFLIKPNIYFIFISIFWTPGFLSHFCSPDTPRPINFYCFNQHMHTVGTFGIRTGVGSSIRCWQVGTSFPGFGFEALLAALTILARGVVFTLALEVPVLQQALRGMEVTLTPVEEKQTTQVRHRGNMEERVMVQMAVHTVRQRWKVITRWLPCLRRKIKGSVCTEKKRDNAIQVLRHHVL